MFKWIKVLMGGKAGLIRLLDDLEPILAAKIKDGQKKAGEIPPEAFAKELVDSIQRFLCKKLDVDPKKVGLE